jgi:hypothetical protein
MLPPKKGYEISKNVDLSFSFGKKRGKKEGKYSLLKV